MKMIYLMISFPLVALAVLAFFTWDDIKTGRIRDAEDAEEAKAKLDELRENGE